MAEISPREQESLEQRLQRVIQRVREAEQRFGRKAGEVQLLPVSKTHSAEDIARLAKLGVRAFGESYLQEAQEKISALAALNLEWHFIGPIQSNKTQAIAQLFDWVHSVDREKIARRLHEQRPAELPPLHICLQVNISGEASKSGVGLEELPVLAQQVCALPRLRLRGLMAIPQPSDDFAEQRDSFRRVREAYENLQISLRGKGVVLDTLSMGMSADLEAAIAEGATIVRVGTDIFGPRH
jgi:pyridoxal phosphate enzyme (YggS family)